MELSSGDHTPHLLNGLELIPSEIIKFLDPLSILSLLAINKHTYEDNEFFHRVVASHLSLLNVLTEEKPNVRERIRYAIQDLGIICLKCGSILDTVYGFFLYKRQECFDCSKNRLAHIKFDPSLTFECDERDHYKG